MTFVTKTTNRAFTLDSDKVEKFLNQKNEASSIAFKRFLSRRKKDDIVTSYKKNV